MNKHISEMPKTEFNRRYSDKKTKLTACRCFPCEKVFEVEGMEEAFCPKCGIVLSKVGYLEEEKEPSDDCHTLCRNVKKFLSFPLVVKKMRKKAYKKMEEKKDWDDIFHSSSPDRFYICLLNGNELSCYGLNGGDLALLERVNSEYVAKHIEDYVGMFVDVRWGRYRALRRVVRSEFDGQIHLATGSADVDWTTCTGPEKEDFKIVAVLRNIQKNKSKE